MSAEFDSFLFSTIVEERNGMPLSVLSALARLDVDPWEEAARLAALPREAAAQALAALIGALPKETDHALDSAAVAFRLVALLPRAVTTRIPATAAARSTARIGMGSLYIAAYLVLMIFLIGSQWLEQRAAIELTSPAPPAAAVAPVN